MNEIVITNTNGELTTSSLGVAERFGKRHSDVLETIENLITEKSVIKNMFIEGVYKAAGNNKNYKYYELTRDGFSLLVMGFTGKKALEWKLKYIEAFNLMEKKLREQSQPTQMSQAEIIAAMANNAVELEKRITEQEKAIAGTNQRIDDMCEIMKPVSDDWRPAMNKLVSRIAYSAEYSINELWTDIYDEVDIRGGVHLDTRPENLRNRMWERGTTWSSCERLNKLDVIQEDKKLIAIYVAVVKDFAAKYIR